MAKKWSEVVASPQYQALDPGQREAARRQYFDQVVAPQVPSQDVERVRQQFDSDTQAPKQWQPVKRDLKTLQAMAGKTEAQNMSGGQQFLTGVEKGVRDFALGTAQAAAEGGPGGQMADWLSRKLGGPGVSNPIADAITGQITQARQADKQLTDTGAGMAGNITGGLAAAMVPGSLAGKASGLTTLGKYGLSALSGAAYGNVLPVADGESRAANVASGAALGAVGQKVGDVVEASGNKAAAAVSDELRKVYDYAKSKGINLTPAQLSNSAFVKRLSLMLDRLPFSGAPARNQAQQAAGNKQLAALIGQPKSGVVDQGTIAKAADSLGRKFDQVFSAGSKLDDQFHNEITALQQEAHAQLDDTAIRAVDGWVARVKDQAKDGKLPAIALQSLDQAVRKAISGGGDRQQIAQAFRESLHENFSRNAPKQLAGMWKTIRQQYATLKTLEPVVARNPEGGVPLQQLQGAINATKRGRTARARGRDGELGQLASVGQRMKGPNSSGTAENLQTAGLSVSALTDLPLTLASLGMGGIGARALNSKGLAALLMRENPGAWRQEIAPYIPAGFLGLTPTLARAEQSKNKR